MKRIARKNIGVLLLLIALAIRFIFSFSEGIFETVYFNGLFPVIRKTQSALSFLWILPGYYALLILLIAWFIWRFPRKKNFRLFLKQLLNLISGIAAVFLLLWGYNYVDKGFAKRIELPETAKLIDISEHYLSTMDSAMIYRRAVPEIGTVQNIVEIKNLPTDSAINEWVKNVLHESGYPIKSTIRVQHIKPSGTLRRINIAGIYNPFTGEANLDNALPSLPRIFTTAHEIAHGYGVTSEAEANFVAFLACYKSGDALGKYAAAYSLWRQMASEINKTYPPESIEILAAQIPPQLWDDRQAILESYYKYKGYFPNLSNALNDTYLKIQGIEKGTDDYDGFLQLYFRWL